MTDTNLSPKAIVSVTQKGKRLLPMDFPWANGVLVSLQGDLSDLDNLQNELNSIKQLVNRDISKFDLNLKDFAIKIVWHQ